MVAVVSEHLGVVHVKFLSHCITVTAEYYYQNMDRLQLAVRQKWPGVIFLHGNARLFTAQLKKPHFAGFHWEVLERRAYSPNLTLSDYHLLEPMKNIYVANFRLSNAGS